MTVIDRGTELRTGGGRHLRGVKDPYVALYKRGLIATSTVVARTDVIRRCGGFDATLPAGQDYELWLKAAHEYGDRIAFLAEPLTRYHVVPHSVTANVWQRRHCALRIAARHRPTLAGRDCNQFAVIASRSAIISLEAAIGHRRRRNWLAAFAALALFPAALFDVLRSEDHLEHAAR